MQEQHHLSFCVVCPAPVGLYRAALIPLTLQHYALSALHHTRATLELAHSPQLEPKLADRTLAKLKTVCDYNAMHTEVIYAEGTL